MEVRADLDIAELRFGLEKNGSEKEISHPCHVHDTGRALLKFEQDCTSEKLCMKEQLQNGVEMCIRAMSTHRD